jgi:hypothetical protein
MKLPYILSQRNEPGPGLGGSFDASGIIEASLSAANNPESHKPVASKIGHNTAIKSLAQAFLGEIDTSPEVARRQKPH